MAMIWEILLNFHIFTHEIAAHSAPNLTRGGRVLH